MAFSNWVLRVARAAIMPAHPHQLTCLQLLADAHPGQSWLLVLVLQSRRISPIHWEGMPAWWHLTRVYNCCKI